MKQKSTAELLKEGILSAINASILTKQQYELLIDAYTHIVLTGGHLTARYNQYQEQTEKMHAAMKEGGSR